MTITCLPKADIAASDHPDFEARIASAGRAFANVEVMVADADDAPMPLGELGEVCVRGDLVMQGYWRNPEATAAALKNGWLHTGDVGFLDASGYLTLRDRSKDMIISGGVNVYPKDIEEIIVAHPAVAEVAVFGVPHDKWGEAPVAAVTLLDGENLAPTDLVAWTNERVTAKFQRLEHCVVLSQFPRNIAGKTLKRELREEYLAS